MSIYYVPDVKVEVRRNDMGTMKKKSILKIELLENEVGEIYCNFSDEIKYLGSNADEAFIHLMNELKRRFPKFKDDYRTDIVCRVMNDFRPSSMWTCLNQKKEKKGVSS